MDNQSFTQQELQSNLSNPMARLGELGKFVEFHPSPNLGGLNFKQPNFLDQLKSSSPSWQAGYPRLGGLESDYTPEIWRVREQAQDLINDFEMLELVRVEHQGQMVIMTIANVWRLTKNISEDTISLHEFCPETDSWILQDPSLVTWGSSPRHETWWPEFSLKTFWPQIFCFTIGRPARNIFFRDITSAVVNYALIRSGWFDLVKLEAEPQQAEEDSLDKLYQELADFYYDQLEMLHGDSYLIRKMLWGHFLNRPLMSLICTKHYGRSITLGQYLQHLEHTDSLTRLAGESRNFLPMLNLIPSNFWGKSDLLNNDILKLCHPALADISSGGLKWLRKAPCSVLCKLYYHRCLPRVVNILSRLNIDTKIPAIVLRRIAQKSWRVLGDNSCYDAFVTRLFRLYALHCLDLWKNRGWKFLRRYVCRSKHLDLVLDWFSIDGVRRRLPDKNSTWLSLIKQAKAWHEALEFGLDDEIIANNSHAFLTWESVFKDTEVNGVSIKALTSAGDLLIEGRQMHHCIGDYVRACLNGYQVFSLKEPDGSRSTLGLEFQYRWEIDQHFGPCNLPVSPKAETVANKIIRHLNSEQLLPVSSPNHS